MIDDIFNLIDDIDLSFLDSENDAQKKLHTKQISITLPSVYSNALGSSKKYILLKGGRGGAKTTSILLWLIKESYKLKYRGTKFLIFRNIKEDAQRGARDNLISAIDSLNLRDDFLNLDKVFTPITNKLTGLSFDFIGTKITRKSGKRAEKNSQSRLKSFNTASLVFFEEAQDFPLDSLTTIFATARSGLNTLKPRFFFAMNPQLFDDAIIKYLEGISADQKEIIHRNIFDLEPFFQDKHLLELSKSQEHLDTYAHIWLGEVAPEIKNLPLSDIVTGEVLVEGDVYAFIDPSFTGGDYTSLAIGSIYKNKVHINGYIFKQSWFSCLGEIVDKLIKNKVDHVFYENNNVSDLPKIELNSKFGIDSIGIYSSGKKEVRISSMIGLKNCLVLNAGVENQGFNKQVSEYNWQFSDYDDAPDALASLLKMMGIKYVSSTEIEQGKFFNIKEINSIPSYIWLEFNTVISLTSLEFTTAVKMALDSVNKKLYIQTMINGHFSSDDLINAVKSEASDDLSIVLDKNEKMLILQLSEMDFSLAYSKDSENQANILKDYEIITADKELYSELLAFSKETMDLKKSSKINVIRRGFIHLWRFKDEFN